MLILISHGSGGIGGNELRLAETFLSKGYNIGLLDYFSKFGIDSLGWIDHGPYIDLHECTFSDMFDFTMPQYDKIVHIGSSLGGYLGLYHSNHFVKNYCFYPGIIALTPKLLSNDYTNTTVFLAKNDNWCDNYIDFENHCLVPPISTIVPNTHHGFMIPNKNREILITKYNTTSKILSNDEFNTLKPNTHSFAKHFSEKNNQTIILQSNEKYSIMCIDQILKEITDL